MRPLPLVAVRQFGVFTAAQALEDGWTMHALRHALRTDQLLRIRPGAYLAAAQSEAAPPERMRQRTAAFALTNPGVAVSHTSAGAVLGVELLTASDLVCATYRRGGRGPMPDVHRHRGQLRPGDVGRRGFIPLTRPARTVFDIGHEHGADAAIVAADSALRQGLTSPARLADVMAATANWPNAPTAHAALLLADGSAESALESVSRLRLATAHLPSPRTQIAIHRRDGSFIGRVDFLWDEYGVVGEADGLAKYALRPSALREEKLRQERLENAGLIVMRWGWADLARFPVVAARLRTAFARGARPDRAPRDWLTEPGWPYQSAAS